MNPTYIHIIYIHTHICVCICVIVHIYVHICVYIFFSLVESHFYHSEYLHLSPLVIALKGSAAGVSCGTRILLPLLYNSISPVIVHVSMVDKVSSLFTSNCMVYLFLSFHFKIFCVLILHLLFFKSILTIFIFQLDCSIYI